MDRRWPEALTSLEAAIRQSGWIGADHVLALRRAIYQNGSIERDEAEFLLHLNRQSRGDDPAWAEFYVEALTDFFYWREGSDSALTEDAEQLLLGRLGEADGSVDDPTELRLLLSLIFRSTGSSERFRAFVLRAVERSVLHSDACAVRRCRAATGRDRPGRRRGDPPPGLRHRRSARPRGQPDRGRVPVRAQPRDRRRRQPSGLARGLRQGGHDAPAVRRRAAGRGRRRRGGVADRPDRHQRRGDDANLRALLDYLRQEAASLDPSLAPLYARLAA